MLLTVLEACVVDSNQAAQQTAMGSLHEAEKQDGYVTALLQVLSAQLRDENGSKIRVLTIICLKNLVQRCWHENRNTKADGVRIVSAAEKQTLRAFLLDCFHDDDRKVAAQLSTLIAKVARSDWPRDWNDLFPRLFKDISEGSSEAECQARSAAWNRSYGAMRVLNEVLEELCSKHMPQTKKALQECSSQAAPSLVQMWVQLGSPLLGYLEKLRLKIEQPSVQPDAHAAGSNAVAARAMLAHFKTTTVVLGYMLDRGFVTLSRAEDGLSATLTAFFEHWAHQLQSLLQFLRSSQVYLREKGLKDDGIDGVSSDGDVDVVLGGTGTNQSSDGMDSEVRVAVICVRRIVHGMSRIAVQLQKSHELPMAPYLSPLLAFFHTQLEQEYAADAHGSAHPSSSVFCMNAGQFLSNATSCRAYEEADPEQAGSLSGGAQALQARRLLGSKVQGSAAYVDEGPAAVALAMQALQQFCSPERAQALMDLLLRHMLRPSPAEQRDWGSDVEQYILTQLGQQEGESTSSAAQSLFMSILDIPACKEVLKARLLGHLYDVRGQQEAMAVEAGDSVVLFWDSVFLCAGLASPDLGYGDEMNATAWLQSALGPLFQAMLANPQAGTCIWVIFRGPFFFYHAL